jgi:hypothetical protein
MSTSREATGNPGDLLAGGGGPEPADRSCTSSAGRRRVGSEMVEGAERVSVRVGLEARRGPQSAR